MIELRSWSLFGVALVMVGCAIESAEGEGGEASGAPEESALATGEGAAEGTPGAGEAPSSPRYDADFVAAGAEFGVPAAILKSIAWTETRFEMVQGEEEFEGKPAAFGVMALRGEHLERGAALAGVSTDTAKSEPRANVRAAAALLSSFADELAIERATIAAWEPVIARYSAIEDDEAKRIYVRDEVFSAMRSGLGAIDPDDRSYWDLLGGPEWDGEQKLLAAGPDYAGSIWRASPNFNSRGSTKPAMVIIHTCEGSYTSCWSWLTNSKSGVSAHYVVKEDGKEVSQLVREASRAWHISATYKSSLNGGVDSFRNGTSSNNFTIGIEHAGYASQKSFPAGQLEASARLVCDISKSQGIPRDRFHVVAHGQLQPYNRVDPGPNWPWASYLQRVNEICGGGGGSAPPPPAPAPAPASGGLVIDSNNARNDAARAKIEVSSNWRSSASIAGYHGTGYWYANTAPVSDGATFWFYLPANATKTIDAHWSASSNRAPDAPFVAFDAQGRRVGVATVDQRTNGGKWNTLGTWSFTAGWNKIVLSRWTTSNKVVVADAVRVR